VTMDIACTPAARDRDAADVARRTRRA
jgi:hypothetical protein